MPNEGATRALACVPDAIPPAERTAHFARGCRLVHELAEERIDLANGYALRFGADALDEVVRFVANERKCCPFLDFELTIGAASGPVWLRMTGPAGTREVLAAELARNAPGNCC